MKLLGVGSPFYIRGQLGRVVRVHPLGTIDVRVPGHARDFRVTGLFGKVVRV